MTDAQPMPSPSSEPNAGCIETPNERASIQQVQDTLVALAERAGFSKSACFAVRLAIEEAIVNAFKHGHKDLPESATIKIEYRVIAEEIHIAVQDQGPGFTPDAVPDPTLDENLELPSGRGLMLMKAYMSDVRHNDAGNRVEMVLRAEVEDDDDDLFVD